MNYWDWWVGAIALGLLTVAFSFVRKQPLGVSGSWARIVLRNHDKAIDKAELPFRKNPGLLEDALMQATIEQFGQQAVLKLLNIRENNIEVASTKATTMPSRVSWTAHFTFLLMLIVGGGLAKLISGDFSIQLNLGELHLNYFGDGIGNWISLFTGGILIGFGTQMAGGCTSGHALSGASRLVPTSLLATGIFFASASITSMLIHYS